MLDQMLCTHSERNKSVCDEKLGFAVVLKIPWKARVLKRMNIVRDQLMYLIIESKIEDKRGIG